MVMDMLVVAAVVVVEVVAHSLCYLQMQPR
jgi:hypothetical protein